MTESAPLTPRQARILAIAGSWIGTPYRHQASLKGVGCDCLGLVAGVWRELYGQEPEQPGPYQPDWAEVAGAERLLDAALRHFGPALPNSERRPADVLLFRWREGSAARHLGILAPSGCFIHAYERGSVIASPLANAWARRIAFTFRFPEI